MLRSRKTEIKPKPIVLSTGNLLDNFRQPLYNIIVGAQANVHVSCPNSVIWRVKCIGYMRKGVLDGHLGSNPDPCCIQNHIITNLVIKRFRCIVMSDLRGFMFHCPSDYNLRQNQQTSMHPAKTLISLGICPV